MAEDALQPSPEFYDRLAPSFDEFYAVPHRRAYDDLAWEHIAQLPIAAPGVVLDLGCGTARWAPRFEDAGWRYIGVDDGPFWEPLREHEEFRADVRVASDISDLERQVAAEMGPDAVLMICKPRPELLSLGRTLGRSVPAIVDIDDPELEVRWGTTKLRSRAALVARYGPSRFRFGWAKRVAKRMNVITSNPVLQSRYGGEVVPHVREAVPVPTAQGRDPALFRVGLIGTPPAHKGI